MEGPIYGVQASGAYIKIIKNNFNYFVKIKYKSGELIFANTTKITTP